MPKSFLEPLICLAARLDGPDAPPFLCCKDAGHADDHECRMAGEVVWTWPRNVEPKSTAPAHSPHGQGRG